MAAAAASRAKRFGPKRAAATPPPRALLAVLAVLINLWGLFEFHHRTTRSEEIAVGPIFVNSTIAVARVVRNAEGPARSGGTSCATPPPPEGGEEDPSHHHDKRGDDPVELYRERVERCEQRQTSLPICRAKAEKTINLDNVHACLGLPVGTLRYPTDAEEHYNEIRFALAPWAQHDGHQYHAAAGYGGPWIENRWIARFETAYDDGAAAPSCLSDVFGPFVPIFVPWVDLWVRNGFRYPPGLVQALLAVLRPDVPYVTVSQNDDGLIARNPLLAQKLPPGILVLSAGGYGHVPVPLLKQSEPRNNAVPVGNRTRFASYVGSDDHAPRRLRAAMRLRLEGLVTRKRGFSFEYRKGDDWRDVMGDSKVSLVPRGFGRTSYHLAETLQMGLIPIHVYSDVPWVPYENLFETWGFVTDLAGLDGLIDQLVGLSDNEFEAREGRIVAMRDSHFTMDGVLGQIANFMTQRPNDLQCQALPRTVRDDPDAKPL